MRAEYDSRADALQIHLAEAAEWVDGREIAGHEVDYDAGGRPVAVDVLSPGDGLDGLLEVADRLGVDREALLATARAALAAPDREVAVDVAGRAAA